MYAVPLLYHNTTQKREIACSLHITISEEFFMMVLYNTKINLSSTREVLGTWGDIIIEEGAGIDTQLLTPESHQMG